MGAYKVRMIVEVLIQTELGKAETAYPSAIFYSPVVRLNYIANRGEPSGKSIGLPIIGERGEETD